MGYIRVTSGEYIVIIQWSYKKVNGSGRVLLQA